MHSLFVSTEKKCLICNNLGVGKLEYIKYQRKAFMPIKYGEHEGWYEFVGAECQAFV